MRETHKKICSYSNVPKEGTRMNNNRIFSKIWLSAALLVTFVAGCGGGGGGGGGGGVFDGTTKSSAKAITAYSLAGTVGIIDETAKTIAVTLPNGTNVTALAAGYTTTGAMVKSGTVTQVSGSTTNNFSAPVPYTVTAVDGTTANYIVTVTQGTVSDKAITAYSLAGVAGTISETARTIVVVVPHGTYVTELPATFSTTGTGVKVGAVVQTSGTTPNNFRSPVVYTVTAANGSTASYSVTVTTATNSAKAITAYSLVGFAGAAGVINESSKTIVVTVPNGTALTALVATFTTTGSGVKVGALAQTSVVTPNNFTNPVVYTVTAADGTSTAYIVTVSAASGASKSISAFSLAGVAGTINESTKTIAVTLPVGTNTSALVATFTTTGTGVKVGAQTQTSGTTSNNFTAPVAYTVTAADASTATYTVTVTLAASVPTGPGAVSLGTAGGFAILSKTGVSTTGTSAVTGNIGVSPNVASSITGFDLIADSTNTFSTSSIVTGKIYASNYAVPTPANMTAAISNMETAYNDAAGRSSPDFTEKGAGNISGLTLVPGLYKWGTGVLISSSGVTLSGGANDVWIFQIAGDLTVNNSAIITLAGGAQAKNIFWQVAGQATLGTGVQFKGIILGKTLISLNTGAVLNGRALAQTAVTLNAASITTP
jgi:hypothetical protein